MPKKPLPAVVGRPCAPLAAQPPAAPPHCPALQALRPVLGVRHPKPAAGPAAGGLAEPAVDHLVRCAGAGAGAGVAAGAPHTLHAARGLPCHALPTRLPRNPPLCPLGRSNGFLIPYTAIPRGWKWLNRLSPTTWCVGGCQRGGLVGWVVGAPLLAAALTRRQAAPSLTTSARPQDPVWPGTVPAGRPGHAHAGKLGQRGEPVGNSAPLAVQHFARPARAPAYGRHPR